jgi:hypothetical protein
VTVNTLAIDLRTVALRKFRINRRKAFKKEGARVCGGRCSGGWVHSGEFGGTSTGDFLDSEGSKLLLKVLELFRQFSL